MFVRAARTLAAAAICAALLIALPLAVVASGAGDPNPKALWDAYALDPAGGGARQGSQPASASAPTSQQEARRSPTKTTTSSARRPAEHGASAALKILMIAGAVLVAIVVGLVPTALLRMAVGILPRPRRRRRVRWRPRRPVVAAVRGAKRARAAKRARVAKPAPAVLAAALLPEPAVVLPAPPIVPARVEIVPQPLVSADSPTRRDRDRHRELYDAEYSEQLDRVQALRRTIRKQIAMRQAPPSIELDR